MAEEGLSTILAKISILENNSKVLAQQINLLNATLAEFNNTLITLSGLKSIKKGEKILMPIGSGVYADIEAGSFEKVTVGVGANVYIKKPLPAAEKYVSDKAEKVRNLILRYQETLNRTLRELDEYRRKAEEIYRKQFKARK